MKFKCQILLLLLLVIFNVKAQTCGGVTCSSTSACIQGKCVRKTFSDPLSLLSLFNTSPKTCPQKPCSLGQICQNKICVPSAQSFKSQNTNAQYGPRTLPQDSILYATYYCDENVYRVCQVFDKLKTPGQQGYAVVLSNSKKRAYLRQQKTSLVPNKQYLVIWNYHVIFLTKLGSSSRVYDFDSRLPWGGNFQLYWDKAISTKPTDPQTLFRVVPYQQYIKVFASDRSGMIKTYPNGTKYYKHPPTQSDPIINVYNETMTLPKFINVNVTDPRYGVVMKPDEFYRFFTTASP